MFWRQSILTSAASLLVCDESDASFDRICLIPGNNNVSWECRQCLDIAASLCRESRGRKILIVEPKTLRATQIGAVPTFEQNCRRGLARRGILADRIEVISGRPDSLLAKTAAIVAWTRAHPDHQVQVLWTRFESAILRRYLDRAGDPQTLARISIRAVPSDDYDEANWWRSRSGVRAAMAGFLWASYAWLYPNEVDAPDLTDADEHERQWLDRIQGGGLPAKTMKGPP